MAYKYKYAPKVQRTSSGPMMGDYMARRAAYGHGGIGGFGSGIEQAGDAIARGMQSFHANHLANNAMQEYNDINPPRASLVGVPGEDLQTWMKQNPNVPTDQTTIPAPYGSGVQGMQDWAEMQRELRAQDTEKQMSIMRGLQASNIQQEMQHRGMDMPGGPLYRGQGGPLYRPLPGQPGYQMGGADRKTIAGINDVHAMIQQRLGQDVDAQTLGQFAGQWQPDPNKANNMINPALAKHLNIDPAATSIESANLQKWGPTIQQEILMRQQHPDYFQSNNQGSAPRAEPADTSSGGGFVRSVIGAPPSQQGQQQAQQQPSPIQQQMQSAGTTGPILPPSISNTGPNMPHPQATAAPTMPLPSQYGGNFGYRAEPTPTPQSLPPNWLMTLTPGT